MARPGKFDHLKPEILAKFQEGLSAAQVAKLYSQVPGSTIRTWFQEFRANSAQIPRNSAPQSQSGSEDSQLVSPLRSKVVQMHPAGGLPQEALADPEFEDLTARKTVLWVRRQLIKEMKRTDNGAVLAQLANSVLRSFEVLQRIPVQDLEQKKEVNLDHLSDAQIARLYQEKLRDS